jgi:fructose-1,6-bisphosphatase I
VVNYKVNKAGLVDIVETLGSRTFKGRSAKLDVYANEIFIQTLINRELYGIASKKMTNLLLLK